MANPAGYVAIAGALKGGPPAIFDSTVFPAGFDTLPFTLSADPKPYGVKTGIQTANVNSPSAFVPLSGIDATIGAVKAGNTLFLRTSGAADIRVTQIDGMSTSVSVIKQVKGLFVIEVADTNAITLVEIKGATITVEWYVSGNS